MKTFEQCKELASGVATYTEHEASKLGIRLSNKQRDIIKSAAMKALLIATKGGGSGLFIGGEEIKEGTRLTSEAIYFRRDSDITKASGNHLEVFHDPKVDALCVKHSATGETELLSKSLLGWQPSIYEIKTPHP